MDVCMVPACLVIQNPLYMYIVYVCVEFKKKKKTHKMWSVANKSRRRFCARPVLNELQQQCQTTLLLY